MSRHKAAGHYKLKSKIMFNLIYQGHPVNQTPFETYELALEQRGLNLINYGYQAEIVPVCFDGEYRVSFFEDSFQFNQEIILVSDNNFLSLKEYAAQKLVEARIYRKGNYWCSFEKKQPSGQFDESKFLFTHRIRS